MNKKNIYKPQNLKLDEKYDFYDYIRILGEIKVDNGLVFLLGRDKIPTVAIDTNRNRISWCVGNEPGVGYLYEPASLDVLFPQMLNPSNSLENIYLAYGKEIVIMQKETGNLRRIPLDIDGLGQFEPFLYKSNIILVSIFGDPREFYISSHDIKTGNKLWQTKDYSNIMGFVVDGDKGYFLNDNYEVVSISCESGDEVWISKKTRDFMDKNKHMVFNNELICFAGNYHGKAYSLDKHSGDNLRECKIDDNIEEYGGKNLTTPAINESIMVVASDDSDLAAVNLRTFERTWKKDLDVGKINKPEISQGNIFITTEHGYVYSYDAVNGMKNWFFDCEGEIYIPPIVEENRLYIATKNELFIFEEN